MRFQIQASRFQISDFTFQVPEFTFQTQDFQVPISHFRFPIFNFGFQIFQNSDARGTGLQRPGGTLGSRAGGTLPGGPQHQPFKKIVSKNPLGKPS